MDKYNLDRMRKLKGLWEDLSVEDYSCKHSEFNIKRTLLEVVNSIESDVNDEDTFHDRDGYYELKCTLGIWQNDGEVEFTIERKGLDVTRLEILDLIEDAILKKYDVYILQLEHACGSNCNCDYEGCWEPLLITKCKLEEVNGYVIFEDGIRVD